jgi:hypothetical protein
VKIAEGWRKSHYEKLRDFYFLQNMIKVLKSSKIVWVGHAAWTGKMLMERNHLQRLGVD